MKVSQFMYEMSQTSAVMGRMEGIDVVFEGDQACTDGKRIVLPTMDMSATLTGEQIRVMRGFVDHEAGHIRHSDMPVIMDFYSRCQNNNKKSLQDIHNCLEDVWMEHKVVDEYPGSHKNLKEVAEQIKRKEYKSFEENGNLDLLKETNVYSVGLTIKGNNPLFLDEREDSHTRKVLGALSPKMREWGEKWVEEVLKCENSSEVITLAKSVYKMLEEDPDAIENQSPEDFDPESGEDMEVGPPGEDQGKDQGKGEGQGEGEGGMESNRVLPDDYLPEPSDAVNASAGDGCGGGIGGSEGPLKGGYRVLSTKDDIVYKRGMNTRGHEDTKIVNIVNNTDSTLYTQLRTQLSSHVAVMKSKLTRALIAQQQRDYDFGREVGRLDTKRLVSAYKGSRSVYKVRKDRAEMDTAVTVLVDLSGSMGGRKVKVARDSALALSECLEGSGISFKVVGFSNNSLINGVKKVGMFHRNERLDTVVFKDYNSSLNTSKGAIARIDDAVGGNNTDYDFIQNELLGLSQRPESRKVLFVLSDGHPSSYSDASTSEHVKHCKKAVEEGERKGIECVGIGICDRAVEKIYGKSVVVNDVSELSSKVFNTLTKLLVK